MRLLFSLLVLVVGFTACVPAKKYKELVEQEKKCNEELEKYKTSSLDYEAQLRTIETKAELLNKEISQLKVDSSTIGNAFRSLQAKYQQEKILRTELAAQIEEIKNSDAKHLAQMRSELESKILESQQKEDELLEMEKILNEKRMLLSDREERVQELEGMIKRQDEAIKNLKSKITQSLRSFENKGLTIEERNGKIYVSLEAKLLFASGSTVVESEGKKAIESLSEALVGNDDMEIIVEGHTDTDRLRSSVHPKNNWELSVLRATAVVDIMTANPGINPAILSASGRSEYHPVDIDDKAKNRRIEVIIAPKLDQLFELISK